MREFHWRLGVRSYEWDAWGQVSSAVMLRYFEQSAVGAAADAGYGKEFHRRYNSGWVIRRMTLLMHSPMRGGDELELVTWISHFARVRGGREYRVHNAESGKLVATGLAEWVYVNRDTLAPMAIPRELAIDFSTPGAPIYTYSIPPVRELEEQEGREFQVERVAQWHEADSLGHVNNAIYADWLDDALRAASDRLGPSTGELRARGLQLRGEAYSLDYKRAAVPGDQLVISTQLTGMEGRLVSVRQAIKDKSGIEMVLAKSVYGWRTSDGEPAGAPEGWGI